jgi:hypothetical protein
MSNDEFSWGVILGFVWSILLIVVPLVLWLTSSFMPDVMFGAFIGATVRFGTDMGLLVLGNGDVEDFDSFASNHLPLVVGLTLLQLGTLVGSAVFWYITGSAIAIGVVLAMLASYAFALVMQMAGGSEQTEADDSGGDSEWRFDLDDV